MEGLGLGTLKQMKKEQMWEDQAAGILDAWNNSTLCPPDKRLSTVDEERDEIGEGGENPVKKDPTRQVQIIGKFIFHVFSS